MSTPQEKRELRKLVNDAIGQQGLAFGPAKKTGGLHVAITDGTGAKGAWSSLTFTAEQTIGLIDKLVRMLSNPEAVPAIARLFDRRWAKAQGVIATQAIALQSAQDEVQRLRWRVMGLERDAARHVPAYSDNTAIVLREGRAA